MLVAKAFSFAIASDPYLFRNPFPACNYAVLFLLSPNVLVAARGIHISGDEEAMGLAQTKLKLRSIETSREVPSYCSERARMHWSLGIRILCQRHNSMSSEAEHSLVCLRGLTYRAFDS